MKQNLPLQSKLEGYFSSNLLFLEKLSAQPFFLSLQRGFTLILPLIMIGSLALLLHDLPFPTLHALLDKLFGSDWRTACDNMISGTFGIASLAMLLTFSSAFTMSHNQRHKKQFVSPTMALIVILSCFFIVTAPTETASWKTIFSMDTGFVVALCVAAIGCKLFLRLAKMKRLQLPLNEVSHDPMVRDILTVMPAGMLTIATFGLIRVFLVELGAPDLHDIVNHFFLALFSNLGDGSLLGIAIAFFSQLFWFFGVHGPNIVSPVVEHFLVPPGIENAAAVLSGHTPVHIYTKEFFITFAYMGGSGSTLSLIFAVLIVSRDGGKRKLCLFALLPALCNVNDPLLFGIPLILNPIYLIPFVLTPLVQTVCAYYATVFDLIPHTIPGVGWTTPVLMSGFASTGSISGAVMQLINILIGVALYYPFVKLSDLLRERHIKQTLSALLRTSSGYTAGLGATKCIDSPGEEGRLAKALASDLRTALTRNDQLFLEYQPQMDVTRNRVHGVEALLRWNHPAYGRISPIITVTLAEDTRCIDELGIYALKTACRQRAEWKGDVPDDLLISVNVSPYQLEDPSFYRRVFETLKLTGLPLSQLELEITESTMITPGALTFDALNRLRNGGVHVAIDDFGMGHASLRYLNEMPVDTIKLDRSLTENSDERINDHIIHSMVELCKSLRMTSIVEGVETEEQLARFSKLGCKIFQGYLFSKPLSAKDCLAYIMAHSDSDQKEK